MQWIHFAFVSHGQCQMSNAGNNTEHRCDSFRTTFGNPPFNAATLHLHVSLFSPYFFLCVSRHVRASFVPSEIVRIISPIFYRYLYYCETSRITLGIPHILNEKSMTMTAIQSFQNKATSRGFIKRPYFPRLLITS